MYAVHRIGNLMIRLHIKLRATVVAFFACSITLLFFVRYNTCRCEGSMYTGNEFMSP